MFGSVVTWLRLQENNCCEVREAARWGQGTTCACTGTCLLLLSALHIIEDIFVYSEVTWVHGFVLAAYPPKHTSKYKAVAINSLGSFKAKCRCSVTTSFGPSFMDDSRSPAEIYSWFSKARSTP